MGVSGSCPELVEPRPASWRRTSSCRSIAPDGASTESHGEPRPVIRRVQRGYYGVHLCSIEIRPEMVRTTTKRSADSSVSFDSPSGTPMRGMWATMNLPIPEDYVRVNAKAFEAFLKDSPDYTRDGYCNGIRYQWRATGNTFAWQTLSGEIMVSPSVLK